MPVFIPVTNSRYYLFFFSFAFFLFPFLIFFLQKKLLDEQVHTLIPCMFLDPEFIWKESGKFNYSLDKVKLRYLFFPFLFFLSLLKRRIKN